MIVRNDSKWPFDFDKSQRKRVWNNWQFCTFISMMCVFSNVWCKKLCPRDNSVLPWCCGVLSALCVWRRTTSSRGVCLCRTAALCRLCSRRHKATPSAAARRKAHTRMCSTATCAARRRRTRAGAQTRRRFDDQTQTLTHRMRSAHVHNLVFSF